MRRPFIICLIIFILPLPLVIGFLQPLLATEIYKVAILPEYLSIEMWQRFHPLMIYLEDTLGIRFELIIPRNFERHMGLVKRGEVHFSYQNPYVFLQLWETCSPLALTERGKGGIKFRGVIITKKDRGINTIQNLRGKKVSVVSFYSASGFIAQKILLKGKLDVHTDLTLIEAKGNKQENVIFDVILKGADAGFVAEEALGRIESKGLLSPGEMQELKIIAYTDWIPNWVFSADKELPVEPKKMVQEALLHIPLGHPVLKAAKVKRFAPIPPNCLEEYRAKVQWR